MTRSKRFTSIVCFRLTKQERKLLDRQVGKGEEMSECIRRLLAPYLSASAGVPVIAVEHERLCR